MPFLCRVVANQRKEHDGSATSLWTSTREPPTQSSTCSSVLWKRNPVPGSRLVMSLPGCSSVVGTQPEHARGFLPAHVSSPEGLCIQTAAWPWAPALGHSHRQLPQGQLLGPQRKSGVGWGSLDSTARVLPSTRDPEIQESRICSPTGMLGRRAGPL